MSGFMNNMYPNNQDQNSLIRHSPGNSYDFINSSFQNGTLPKPAPNGTLPTSIPNGTLGTTKDFRPQSEMNALDSFYGPRENNFPPARMGMTGQTIPGSTLLNIPPPEPTKEPEAETKPIPEPVPEKKEEPVKQPEPEPPKEEPKVEEPITPSDDTEAKKVKFEEKPSEIVPVVMSGVAEKEEKPPKSEVENKVKEVKKTKTEQQRKLSKESAKRTSKDLEKKTSKHQEKRSSKDLDKTGIRPPKTEETKKVEEKKPKSIMKPVDPRKQPKPVAKKAPKIVEEPKAKLIDDEESGTNKSDNSTAKCCCILWAILFFIALVALIIVIVLAVTGVININSCPDCDPAKAKETITRLAPSNLATSPFPNSYYGYQDVSKVYYLLEGDTNQMQSKSPYGLAAMTWHCGVPIFIIEEQASIGISAIQTEFYLGDPMKGSNQQYTMVMKPGYKYTVRLRKTSISSKFKHAIVSLQPAGPQDARVSFF